MNSILSAKCVVDAWTAGSGDVIIETQTTAAVRCKVRSSSWREIKWTEDLSCVLPPPLLLIISADPRLIICWVPATAKRGETFVDVEFNL